MAAALIWERHVRVGREASALLGESRYLELRYEALVAEPEGECRRLCDFLRLTYDPTMLRFHEGRTRNAPGLSAKKAWKPITAGLRSWRDQMTHGEVARFEAGAGDLLEELGYDAGARRSADDELARARRLRDVAMTRARSRGDEVPQAWEPVRV